MQIAAGRRHRLPADDADSKGVRFKETLFSTCRTFVVTFLAWMRFCVLRTFLTVWQNGIANAMPFCIISI